MKKLFLFIAFVFLVACSETSNQTQNMNIPPELSDCIFFTVATKDGDRSVDVVRCPNSTVSTTREIYNAATKKHDKYTTVVIDGDEYVKVNK